MRHPQLLAGEAGIEDLSLGWTDFEREAVASSTQAAYGRTSYPVARAEDLVVFKSLAARPKDIEDAAALVLMHPAIDLDRVRRRLVPERRRQSSARRALRARRSS